MWPFKTIALLDIISAEYHIIYVFILVLSEDLSFVLRI